MTKTRRRDKTRVCQNGLDVDAFSRDLEVRRRVRESLGLTTEFVWVAVGRQMEAKNYPLLIQAFADHLKHRNDSVLLMVGDGADRNVLELQCKELRISERGRFLGERRDIPDLFAAADAHVMSSRLEGLPMVLLEASCAGLYSVATDVGSISEVLDGGRLGRLTLSEDALALTAAMNEVTDFTLDELKEKGAQARDFVRGRYSIEAVVDEWIAIYREIIAARNATASK